MQKVVPTSLPVAFYLLYYLHLAGQPVKIHFNDTMRRTLYLSNMANHDSMTAKYCIYTLKPIVVLSDNNLYN